MNFFKRLFAKPGQFPVRTPKDSRDATKILTQSRHLDWKHKVSQTFEVLLSNVLWVRDNTDNIRYLLSEMHKLQKSLKDTQFELNNLKLKVAKKRTVKRDKKVKDNGNNK